MARLQGIYQALELSARCDGLSFCRPPVFQRLKDVLLGDYLNRRSYSSARKRFKIAVQASSIEQGLYDSRLGAHRVLTPLPTLPASVTSLRERDMAIYPFARSKINPYKLSDVGDPMILSHSSFSGMTLAGDRALQTCLSALPQDSLVGQEPVRLACSCWDYCYN